MNIIKKRHWQKQIETIPQKAYNIVFLLNVCKIISYVCQNVTHYQEYQDYKLGEAY